MRAGRLLVRVRGDLDLHGAEAFRRQIDGLIARTGARRVLLNLQCVSFIDSSGLGAILGRLRRIQAVGGSLGLVPPTASARTVFDAGGLGRILSLFASEQDFLVSEGADV